VSRLELRRKQRGTNDGRLYPHVPVHSIVAVEGDGPIEEGSYGVVNYSSAHIEGVESERVVRSTHSTQGHPDTIAEVHRILLKHAAGR